MERKRNGLVESLRKNPKDKASHMELIDVLRNMGDFIELRNARTAFQSIYPFTEELWLTWLSDEESMATSSDALLEHLQLYKKCTEECSSVKIWIRRLTFESKLLKKGISSQETMDKSLEDHQTAQKKVNLVDHSSRSHFPFPATLPSPRSECGFVLGS